MNRIIQKSGFFYALSDPIRLGIIETLLKENKCDCINVLSKGLKRDQSVISRHIHKLEKEGIIEIRKEGKFVMCSIKDKARMEKILSD